MMIKELNKSDLSKIAKKNGTSEAVFSVIALRERNRQETNLRRLRDELLAEGFKVVPNEFTAIFRDLAKAGIGDLVSEKGKPAKFRWNFAMKDIGKIGIETPAGIKVDNKPVKVYSGTQEGKKMDTKAKRANEVVNRIAAIKDQLELVKPLYEELDDLTEELLEVAEVNQTLKTDDNRLVTLIDNFADKNTVFRSAAVRRFEAELLTADEMTKKLIAAEKKAAKAAKVS